MELHSLNLLYIPLQERVISFLSKLISISFKLGPFAMIKQRSPLCLFRNDDKKVCLPLNSIFPS